MTYTVSALTEDKNIVSQVCTMDYVVAALWRRLFELSGHRVVEAVA